MVGISKSIVRYIMAENFDIGKAGRKWLSLLLAMEEKQRRENVSIGFFAAIRSSFCGDSQPWMKHGSITLYLKRKNGQNNELKSENQLQKGEDSFPSTDWVVVSVIWDARGIIFINYLQGRKIINVEYYVN